MSTPAARTAARIAYEQRQRDAGLTRVSVWVPAHRVEELREIADEMIRECNNS